jgi:hypothetical protein
MEVERSGDSDEYSSPQSIISLVEEEEVVLYWNEGQKYRCIRELAGNDGKENRAVLSYYR